VKHVYFYSFMYLVFGYIYIWSRPTPVRLVWWKELLANSLITPIWPIVLFCRILP